MADSKPRHFTGVWRARDVPTGAVAAERLRPLQTFWVRWAAREGSRPCSRI